jgi:hypothetical protein
MMGHQPVAWLPVGPACQGPGPIEEQPPAPPEPPAGAGTAGAAGGDVGHGQAARQSNRLDSRQGSCHDAAGRATGMPTLIGGPGRRDFEHGWTRVPKIMQYYRVLRMSRRQCTCPRACGPTEASVDPNVSSQQHSRSELVHKLCL